MRASLQTGTLLALLNRFEPSTMTHPKEKWSRTKRIHHKYFSSRIGPSTQQ